MEYDYQKKRIKNTSNAVKAEKGKVNFSQPDCTDHKNKASTIVR